MKKLTVIIEKGDGELWARTELLGHKIYTAGENLAWIEKGIKELVADYKAHESAEVKEWESIDLEQIQFEYVYDVAAFFEQFDAIKITAIAKLAGMNPGLVRQYASGVKFPSAAQVKKLEEAIHELGKQLLEINLMAA